MEVLKKIQDGSKKTQAIFSKNFRKLLKTPKFANYNHFPPKMLKRNSGPKLFFQKTQADNQKTKGI